MADRVLSRPPGQIAGDSPGRRLHVLVVAVGIGALLLGVLGSVAYEHLVRTAGETWTGVQEASGRVSIVQVHVERGGGTNGWLVAAGVAAGLAVVVGLGLLAARRIGRSMAAREAEAAATVHEVTARERDQRRFLEEIAHELRTPITIAGTNLELARGTSGLDDDAAAQIDAAQRAVSRMTRTVDDLSVRGRLQLEPDHGAADLVAEVLALVGEHAGPARLQGVEVWVDAPPASPVEVAVDRTAVHLAVTNLVTNAVRVAPVGSAVTVSIGTVPDWAWVAVSDEGAGIETADHARVFEPYWRGRRDRQDPSSGTGLGLAIARQMADAAGGRLTMRSTPGCGSTFVLWLRRGAGAASHADLAAIVEPDGIHHRVGVLPIPVAVPS